MCLCRRGAALSVIVSVSCDAAGVCMCVRVSSMCVCVGDGRYFLFLCVFHVMQQARSYCGHIPVHGRKLDVHETLTYKQRIGTESHKSHDYVLRSLVDLILVSTSRPRDF